MQEDKRPTAEPDLQLKRGRGVGGHPNAEIRGGGEGPTLKKHFFPPCGPQFGLKIRGGGDPDPSPGSATAVGQDKQMKLPF